MRYGLLLSLSLIALVAVALPAEACEECAMYYDYQAHGSSFEYCDSAWDDSDGDQCFTEEGIAKKRCGPYEKDPVGALAPSDAPAEWRLVRARVEPRVVAEAR